MNGHLINCNLAQFSEAICAIIENVQSLESEIKILCKKFNIGESKHVSVRLLNLSKNGIIDKDKNKLVYEILDARNLIIHQFYLTEGKCLIGYRVKDIEFDNDIMNDLIILDKLIYETRDYIANKMDKENRANFIYGTYEISK